jgi:hypothetical protein
MFVVRHPEYSLSKSVLVFILNEKYENENNTFPANKQQKQLLQNIGLLQKRGRQVRLFYDSEILKVYEIINEPQESKISDLIF